MTSSTATLVAATPPRVAAKRYVAGPVYDHLFLILSPLLALLIAEMLPAFRYPFEETNALGATDQRIALFIGVWTSSHLAAVLFRSHVNRDIFVQYRFRFLVVPVLLVFAIFQSSWVHVSCYVLAVLWDIYHSAMQNFGLCRIYDARLGNDARAGRKLDLWLNQVIYTGPLLAGLSFIPTLDCFRLYQTSLGWSYPAQVVRWLADHAVEFRYGLIAVGASFLLWYIVGYARLVRSGYKIARTKVLLLLSVATSSIWAWGFLPPIEAAFVANLYHALQYFAIVWWMERKTVTKTFGLSRLQVGQWIALLAFVAVLLVLGMGMEYSSYSYSASGDDVSGKLKFAAAAALTCSLLHFWYDGFIWSVRRKQV